MQNFLRFARPFVTLIALLPAAAGARADEIFLRNGDRISGEIIEATDLSVTVRTEALGTVTVDRAYIHEEAEPEEHAVPDPLPPPAEPMTAEAPEVRVEKPWDGSISGGINAREGNTSSQSASGRFSVGRKKGPDELLLEGDFYFASSRKKMTAMKMLGGVRYDRYFEPENRGWYGLGRFEADQDRFADINQRLIPGVGPGYAFFNTEDFKIKAETAAGFAQTNFSDATANRFEALLIPRFLFESRIYGRSRFIQEVTAYVSLDASNGYRVRSESAVEAPFIDRLKVRLSVIDEFNSNPSAGAQNNDIRLISSVAYYL
jgi:putative salt-induced outer membrane protein YdiY